MSNLVHRRRRCARIVPYMVLLPGGQYARGQGRSLHQAKDIVVAPGEPFCTANGSYFVFWGLRRSCMAGLGVAALGCCQDAS